MRPEALDAFATHSIRPGALEAAVSDLGDTNNGETPAMKDKKKDVSTSPILCSYVGFNNGSPFRREQNPFDQS